MTYILAKGESVIQLEMEVKKLIDQGYKPLGGVCVVATGVLRMYLYQSMVKE